MLLAAKGLLTVVVLQAANFLLIFISNRRPVSRLDLLVEYGITLAVPAALTCGLAWLTWYYPLLIIAIIQA